MEFEKSYEEIVKDYEQEYRESYPSFRRIPSGTVLDEDKSVRWNREEVERRNAEAKEKEAKAYKYLNHITAQFFNNVSEALHNSFTNIPVQAIKEIVEKVWERVDRKVPNFIEDVWFTLEMAEKAVLASKGMDW